MPRFEDGSVNLRKLMRRIAEDVVSAIERLSREIRRLTRVVGAFPDGKSALMLVTARLKYIAENEWGRRRYLDVSLLEERGGAGCRPITPMAPPRHRKICERSLTVPVGFMVGEYTKSGNP